MIYESVPEGLGEVVDRLENWGRWAREGSSGRQPLGSAEGRYIPERGDMEPRRTPSLFVDAFDAQLVDKCLAPAGGFPKRWSDLLKWRYYRQAKGPVICRKMSIHFKKYNTEFAGALYGLRNVLKQRKI